MAVHEEQILVVDDDTGVRNYVCDVLEEFGYKVSNASSAPEAMQLSDRQHFDLVITDVRMPRVSGLELVKHLKRRGRDVGPEVIVMTAFATIEDAVEAIHLGAYNYMEKPVKAGRLRVEMERALERKRLLQENEWLRQEVERAHHKTIISRSKQMQQVFDMIQAVSRTDTTVLILGETGTGKELVARAIHQNSQRRDREFVAVNCAALQESLLENELFGHEKGAFTGADRRMLGRFDLANHGTIFLDEVGEISPSVQVKLLRVLQSGEFQRVGSPETVKVDVRVVAATNIALEAAVEEGRFRQDFYYRLNVISIQLPPLKEREEDVPLLVRHFLQQYGPDKIVPPETMGYLTSYQWPGNVRELENVIERACVLAWSNQMILPEHLPEQIRGGPVAQLPIGGTQTLETVERRHIELVLEQNDWNITQAAQVLGIDRSTLHRKIERYSLFKAESPAD